MNQLRKLSQTEIKYLLMKDSETNVIGISEKNIPIVACWRIDFYHVAFFCRHCNKIHRHGWAEGNPNGHRVEHCNKENSPFEDTGYILICQGSLWGEYNE